MIVIKKMPPTTDWWKNTVIDPNANREIVVKKINNLRTTYKKELNKMKKSNKSGAATDEIYTTRLWYFNLLNFLYDQELPRPSITNIDQNEEQSSETSQQSDDIGSQSQYLLQHNESDSERDTPTPNRSDSERDTPTPNRSDSERDTPTPNRSDSERDTPIPNRRSRPVKTTYEDVLKSVNEHFKGPKTPESRFEVYGKNVAMKLQELPKDQRILAEKIINKALFLAEMGSLNTSHSVRNSDFVNTTFSIPPHPQIFSTQPHTQTQYPIAPIQSHHSPRSPFLHDESDNTAANYLSHFSDR